MREFKDHNLTATGDFKEIIYEKRPAIGPSGEEVKGLYTAWITLNNPEQLNSYTTSMVMEVIAALRTASNDRSVTAVVMTAAGDRAFCTGGNTKEYAEYYAGHPQEYRQYMRLFNDMVTSVLTCDRPVICRVNGMRLAGGQEVGMACDFSIASDLARFGQAGPRHGSAPDGGSTDFLHLYVGIERAMESCTLCEMWSAHKAYRLGLLYQVAPVLKVDGKFIPNPMVVTDRYVDEQGRIVYGEPKEGEALKEGKALMKRCEVDLSMLDKAVQELCTKLMMKMPECTQKTIESLRKKKLEHWDRNRETNRAWLALNMMSEAKAGFTAFNVGSKGNQEADFIKLRQMLAEGKPWNDELIQAILPKA